MILGIDISTSITGFAIVGEGQIVYYDSIDLRKHKNVFEKVDHFRKFLSDTRFLQAVVREVWIEQPFMFFNSGGSSAKTMSLLQKFNGMVSLAVRDHYGIEPQYVGASEARKLNEIKVPRGTKAKEQVLKFLLDTTPTFKVEYTKHGNPKPGYYDRADSVVIARAGQALWKNKNFSS